LRHPRSALKAEIDDYKILSNKEKLTLHRLRPVAVEVTGNLNLFYLFSKFLGARGLIGVKACILKPRTIVL
jgi:hypothetical protein